jgi:hypothetical protein
MTAPTMIRRIAGLLLGVSLLLATGPEAAGQQSAQPPERGAQGRGPAPAQAQTPPCPIVADPPGADFGIVAPGTVVASTIKLINPFDRPVRILEAKPSCTCTTVDMKGKVIPEKGFLEMPMSMKTANSIGSFRRRRWRHSMNCSRFTPRISSMQM